MCTLVNDWDDKILVYNSNSSIKWKMYEIIRLWRLIMTKNVTENIT